MRKTVVDLFCGAGGLSLGFERAGFAPAKAFDNWDAAVQTYRANLGEHVIKANISGNMELPESLVIIGGPPCQGFSSAGMRKYDDCRNSLVRVYAELIARVRPAAFVFENVEGFLTGAEGEFVLDLLEPLVEAGYRIHLRKINAANYGVPQHRKRVIAIGGLGWDPKFPVPTHTAHGAPGSLLAAQRLPRAPSLADALLGLPTAVAADGCRPKKGKDHSYRPLQALDRLRAENLAAGQTMRDLPAHLQHASYRRRANRRVMDGIPTARRGGAPSGIRRLRFDEPAKAITGGALSEFFHPSEPRNLTIRECARIQTFPDEFRFIGAKNEQIQLIGNAVPPLLAERIAATLLLDLDRNRPTLGRGKLLSFVPTLSMGMSPALRQAWDKVMRRFSTNRQLAVQEALWG